MTERGSSRIAAARQRVLAAKQRLAIAATAGFVALVGLAWASHPGKSSGSVATSSDASVDRGVTFFEEDGDFGGFDSFDGIAPSNGPTPQIQTGVS
jgi:hypothetical protein